MNKLARIITLLFSTALILPLLSSHAYSDDLIYTVRPGDTFWGICEELSHNPDCIDEIQRYNASVKDVRKLPQGLQIKVPTEWLKNPPRSAEVEFVRGVAWLYREQSSNKRVMPGGQLQEGQTYLSTDKQRLQRMELSAGTELRMGDRIVTERGNVVLRFADNSSFLIKPDSDVVLERLSAHGGNGMVDTHMRLNKGVGRATVNTESGRSRFQISTPAAIAAARGTVYTVRANSDGTIALTEVLQGDVAVSGRDVERAVGAGFGTRAKQSSGPGEVRALMEAPRVQLGERTAFPMRLNWQNMEAAESYSVEVYEGTQRKVLLNSQKTNDPFADFTNLPEGSATFVVQAIDDIGLHGKEAVLSTELYKDLKAPLLELDALRIENGDLHLHWASLAAASAYRVQVSEDAHFENLVVDEVVQDNEFHTVLDGKKARHVRVQAEYDTLGVGPFSNTLELKNQGEKDWWWLALQSLGMVAVLFL